MATITLNDFDDIYTATDAGDVILGIGGNDTLTASAGGNTLYGGDGDDVLNGAGGNDILQGDNSTGSDFQNIMKGFGGNDTIVSNSWSDEVNAGAGDDLVTSAAQRTSQVLDGGAGTDRLTVTSLVNVNDPVNVAFGSTFVFIVKGINGATYMNFEALQVTLGTGENTVVGSNGNDRLFTAYLNGSNATVDFDAGFVRAEGGDDQVAFNGLAGSGTGIQRMDGGTGIDTLSWTGGNADIAELTINAARGNLTANGTKTATFENFEGVSFRLFTAATGVVSYSGFAGNDSVWLGGASVSITTLGGNDSVEVTAGSGTADGGAGDDFLRASFPNQSDVTLRGGSGNDTVIGGAGEALLYGGDGDDLVQANNSHSQVFGGQGNDDLALSFLTSQTGSGDARVDGGAGADVLTLTLLSTSTPLVLDLSTPTITLPNGCFITGVEGIRLLSTSGADSITASNDARGALFNTVDGGFGNDTLRASANGASLNGGFGADELFGAAGNDILVGGFGGENDTLRGAGGDDTLIGSIGRDLLIGGAGADHFTLSQYFESGTTGTTRDLISDFSRAQGDKFDLAAVDAVQTAAAPGDQAFDFIGGAAFGNVAGELRFEKVNLPGTADDHTLISGDIQGDGVADFTLEVKGLFDLIRADFVL